jgi:integrase
MAKSELDLANRTWTIPKNRTKNGDEHVVPLSDLAMQIIQPAVASATGDHLFMNHKGKPFDRNAVTRAVGRLCTPSNKKPKGKLEIDDWTPHDLRRTVSTHMSLDENNLNIPELHISHVLNHRSHTRSSVTQRVYNRNRYLNEKREALEKWANFLANLVGVPTTIAPANNAQGSPAD